MKFDIATCPTCGEVPRRAEHTTLGSHSLDYDDDDGSFEWGDDRQDSAECDESTCIAEAKDAVYGAACDLVDAHFEHHFGSLVTALERLRDAVVAARAHGDGCIVLRCVECSTEWHARVLDEEDERDHVHVPNDEIPT